MTILALTLVPPFIHGFWTIGMAEERVEREGLPNSVRETHVSLFDGSNCGIELLDRPAFSVQYHPEASPGPQDSFYLFERFVGGLRA